jgi:hypothetical protein
MAIPLCLGMFTGIFGAEFAQWLEGWWLWTAAGGSFRVIRSLAYDAERPIC